jgi:hypothetical protein
MPKLIEKYLLCKTTCFSCIEPLENRIFFTCNTYGSYNINYDIKYKMGAELEGE